MVMSHRSLLWFGSLVLAAGLSFVFAAGLVLAHGDDQIVGNYLFENGVIEGSVSEDGTVLTGTWIEDGPQVGGFIFTLAVDCQSFTGTWGNGASVNDGGIWDGTLVSGDDDCSWVGTWDTTFNEMFLFKADDSHKTTICHKGKTITVANNAVPAHLNHGDTLGPCLLPE